jgi:hypothetical protein
MTLMRNVTLLDRTHYKTIHLDFPEKQQRTKGFKQVLVTGKPLNFFNYIML